jgi:hypothetical protein
MKTTTTCGAAALGAILVLGGCASSSTDLADAAAPLVRDRIPTEYVPVAEAPAEGAHDFAMTQAANDVARGERWLSTDLGMAAGVVMDPTPMEEATPEADAADAVDITQQDETGTDPRGFSNRLMPYYWYGKMKNGAMVQNANLFGMIAVEQRVALTYDWPLAKKMDVSRVTEFKKLGELGGFPPGFGSLPGQPGGAPFKDFDGDGSGDETGMGDLNVRGFYMPKAWDSTFEHGFGPNEGEQGSMNHLVGLEMTLPTATEDVLGGEALIISPLYTFVVDTPMFGFVALMNFWDIDAWKDDDRPDTNRYRGRWFFMQPLAKPGPGLMDGIYLLPEMQPIYDFEEDHFSFWIGPELGKIVAPGRIIYFKPGWGVSPDRADGDREWTFEFGVRIFF